MISKAETVTNKKETLISKEETVVRELLKLWSRLDPDTMANLFGEDAIYDNVPNNAPMEGRKAIRQWLAMVAQHLSHIDVEVINLAVNGEWVLSERVDNHVFPHKVMPLRVMNACRVVDGKIQVWRDYYDHQTVVSHGVIPE